MHYHHIICSYSEEKTSGTEQDRTRHPLHETKEVMYSNSHIYGCGIILLILQGLSDTESASIPSSTTKR